MKRAQIQKLHAVVLRLPFISDYSFRNPILTKYCKENILCPGISPVLEQEKSLP